MCLINDTQNVRAGFKIKLKNMTINNPKRVFRAFDSLKANLCDPPILELGKTWNACGSALELKSKKVCHDHEVTLLFQLELFIVAFW